MAKQNETTKPTTTRKPRVPHVKSELELKIEAAHKASQQPVKVVRKIARILVALPPERQRVMFGRMQQRYAASIA